MMRAALIAAALLAACSPASDTPASSDPPASMGSFAAAPVVHLQNAGGEPLQVEAGQVLVFEMTLDRLNGEDLRPVGLPPFIEYFGRRNHIDRSRPPSPNDRRTGGNNSDTYVFIFVVQAPGEGELVLQSYSSRYPDFPVQEVFRATIVARAPSGVIGARNAPSNPAVMPAVQLDAAPWHGRVEVAVGQVMQFRTSHSYSPSRGEVVKSGVMPDFVEYVGVEVSNSDGQGASADYVFTFVARRPGVGVLTMQHYNHHVERPPMYEVLKVIIVAR